MGEPCGCHCNNKRRKAIYLVLFVAFWMAHLTIYILIPSALGASGHSPTPLVSMLYNVYFYSVYVVLTAMMVVYGFDIISDKPTGGCGE